MNILGILRVAGSVVAAIVVVIGLLIAVELFSAVVHPLPADFDGSHEAMCEHVARYPDWVLAAVVPMWGAAAFAGTWLAGWLGNRVGALVVGVLLMAAATSNLAMLPYPAWFKLVQPLAIIAAVACAYWMANRRGTAAPSGRDKA